MLRLLKPVEIEPTTAPYAALVQTLLGDGAASVKVAAIDRITGRAA